MIHLLFYNKDSQPNEFHCTDNEDDGNNHNDICDELEQSDFESIDYPLRKIPRRDIITIGDDEHDDNTTSRNDEHVDDTPSKDRKKGGSSRPRSVRGANAIPAPIKDNEYDEKGGCE